MAMQETMNVAMAANKMKNKLLFKSKKEKEVDAEVPAPLLLAMPCHAVW